MEHLTSETLARLVDERPNPDERSIYTHARSAPRSFGHSGSNRRAWESSQPSGHLRVTGGRWRRVW